MTRNAVAYLRSTVQLVPDRGPWALFTGAGSSALPAGLEIVATVADEGLSDRRGLAAALHRIAAGEADTLLVARLNVAASSLGALVRLLDWLDAAGASLLATDVGLDTSNQGGRKAVALLNEIERWGHGGGAGRAARGRPGLSAASPALAHRIARLRERGLSLQSIADALNEEGVPTPRGGARWRASSVQSALGYRRPRPPAPGAPPLPTRGAGHRPGSRTPHPDQPPPRPGKRGPHERKLPCDGPKPPPRGRPAGRPAQLPRP